MAIERRAEAKWIESKKYWEIKVQKNGVRDSFRSSTKGRKGKHEAEAKADKWLATGTSEMRFDAAWELFMKQVKANTGTGNYINTEKAGRLYLLPSLRLKKLSSITRSDWQSCITSMVEKRDKPLSERTCRNTISTINSFLTFCDGEHMEFSPIKKPLTIPSNATPTKEKKILQPDGLRILFSDSKMPYRKKVIDAFYINAWRFYVVTGLRRGELVGLRQEDVSRLLTVRRNINNLLEETHGKNDNARRTMVLSNIASSILADQRRMLENLGIKSKWVFPDPHGERSDPNLVYKHWKKYCEYHGFESTVHELRHTFVSINKVGTPEVLIKSLVGHSVSMDTIGVYGHEVDGEKELAAQYVDAAFNKIFDISN